MKSEVVKVPPRATSAESKLVCLAAIKPKSMRFAVEEPQNWVYRQFNQLYPNVRNYIVVAFLNFIFDAEDESGVSGRRSNVRALLFHPSNL